MKKTLILTVVSLILAGVMLFSCTSCASLVISASANELSADYDRTATDLGEVSEEFIAAMADFSFKLFGGILTGDDQKNDLVSPLSAIICLAMIANGADGETLAEMEKAFGMNIDELNRSLYAFTNSLYTADDCKLGIADSIWFRNTDGALTVRPEFLQANADWYESEVYAAPFDNSTVNDINNWCKKQTDGMIDKIIEEIDERAVMYLINAMVFDAKWQKKYEKNDRSNHVFHNYSGSEATVKMLSSEEAFYIKGEKEVGFKKSYSGSKYSLLCLLPDEGVDIFDYAASLNGEKWLSLYRSGRYAEVKAKLPEFTYESEMQLNDVLSAIGMNSLFDSSKADLSRIGSSSWGNLYCSAVSQKVYISVDMNGTKAAAVTWGAINAECAAPAEPIVITLDRPFVYAITDDATGLPLFVGVVSELN